MWGGKKETPKTGWEAQLGGPLSFRIALLFRFLPTIDTHPSNLLLLPGSGYQVRIHPGPVIAPGQLVEESLCQLPPEWHTCASGLSVSICRVGVAAAIHPQLQPGT